MRARKPHAEHLDVDLVRRLLAEQFPEWAELPIRPVSFDGWDNTTFRVGDDMSVRLPSHAAYAPQVDKEQEWLPALAPSLPLPIPTPLAKGEPTEVFPLPWSVYRWIDGEIAAHGTHAVGHPPPHIDDLTVFATALGEFLRALQRVDATDGPDAGPHSFWRGGPLAIYDPETRETLGALRDRIDGEAATEVWEAALERTWEGPPVWVHGDVAPTNLLVRDGRLSAVIDFGCSAVGDPACDLAIAWTFFTGESREAFRAALPLDPATWARGRGWALWKALITLARTVDPEEAADARSVIDEILTDHASTA